MADKQVLEALGLFNDTQEVWTENYRKSRDDLRFLTDDDFAQWDEKEYQNRVISGRPALTIDQLSQFIHQVSNDIRMNTPAINVIPYSSDADEETAEIFKGYIRNIEYYSRADDAYDTASLNAIRCGIGWLRFDHEYETDDGFDQTFRIKKVANPLSCYIDPGSIETDGSDAMFGFALETLAKKQFQKEYPRYAPVSFDAQIVNEDLAKVNGEDVMTIAEFLKIKETPETIAIYEDGQILPYDPRGPQPFRVRQVMKRTVIRQKLSGEDVLEETTFPGIYLPLIPVYGEELWSEGKRYLFSLIRKSKDAQRMFNYWKSLETELLMKQPQAPVMAAEGQIEDYATDWANPSKAMALRYKSRDSEGNPLPPPQRLEPPTIPTGVVNASRQTIDDIKSTMGIYNASLGARSNETSGIAIQRRQQEGDVATYHFGDNLNKSITQLGRALVYAIPDVVDTARTIRIVKPDETQAIVGVNGQMAEGQERPYDLQRGKYEVRVTTGASFTTRRQEAAALLQDIVSKQPQFMEVAGDILFENMDVAGSQQLAERMKRIIPPNILGEEGQDPQVQALTAQNQQLQTVAQGLQQQLADKTQKEAADIQLEKMKLDIEAQKNSNELKVKEAEILLKARELEIKNKEVNADIEQMVFDALARLREAEMPSEGIGESQSPANQGGVE